MPSSSRPPSSVHMDFRSDCRALPQPSTSRDLRLAPRNAKWEPTAIHHGSITPQPAERRVDQSPEAYRAFGSGSRGWQEDLLHRTQGLRSCCHMQVMRNSAETKDARIQLMTLDA